MGAQGAREGVGRNLVLDAGALIDLERGGEMMIALAEYGEKRGNTLIPASVLGQVWRGGPRSAVLAKVLEAAEVDVLDESRAREIGVRLGIRGGRDVVDAHVVCCAVEREAAIVTSDSSDMEALIGPDEVVRVMPA
jgi:predicted nucleic acid-binding protein